MNATEFRLTGQVSAPGFADWICHRAKLLNLKGWVSRFDVDAVMIVVCGPLPLIDAMEMACSLGPIDVFVERIDAFEIHLDEAPNGFHLRSNASEKLPLS
ncbi:MAG: acylphosphatase [Pseudomonadota bacterium]